MPEIVIHDCNIGEWSSFNESGEAVLCLDRLVNHPCKVLIGKYELDNKMKYLHFILPHIAKLFGIDRKKLTEEWAKVFGIWEVFGKK